MSVDLKIKAVHRFHAIWDDLQMFCNPDGSLRAAYSRFGSPYTALIAALSPPRRLFLSWNPKEVLVSSLSFLSQCNGKQADLLFIPRGTLAHVY